MDLLGSFTQLTIGYSIEQLVIGYIMGILVGLTGIGAGILAMPAMIFFAHLDSVSAIGTSLFFSVLSRIYGVRQHWKMGFIDQETNFYFSLGAVPTVLLASYEINYLKTIMNPETLDYYMRTFLSGTVFVVAIYLAWDAFKKNQSDLYKCGDPLMPSQKANGVLFGGIIGGIVGATSIGGGVFIIPILTGVFKLSAKCVVGTSNMISVALTLIGSGVYIFYGNVNYAVAILVAAGSLPGIKLGAGLAQRLSNVALKKIIAGLALISLMSMMASIKH